MGDHIVRRGAAGSSTRRSEPRPTAELSKKELNGLIRQHDREHEGAAREALEPELEIGGDTPRVPSASSPRMFAHTLRRAPSPDPPAQTARGSTSDASRGGGGSTSEASFGSTGPREGGVPRGDVSTIEMPRVERS